MQSFLLDALKRPLLAVAGFSVIVNLLLLVPAVFILQVFDRMLTSRSQETLLVLIAVNALVSSRYPWWLWAFIAWIPLIAAHTAWSMGMFERNKKGS